MSDEQEAQAREAIFSREVPQGLYWWVRTEDETGMSGTGPVAQVSVFEDGSATLRWLKSRNTAGVCSTVFYGRVGELLWVHGHGLKQVGHLKPVTQPDEVVLREMFERLGYAGVRGQLDAWMDAEE